MLNLKYIRISLRALCLFMELFLMLCFMLGAKPFFSLLL